MRFFMFLLIICISVTSVLSSHAEVDSNKTPQGTENVELSSNCSSTPKDCLQLIRASYITSSVCGQAAICYWELWNYRTFKALAVDQSDYLDKYKVCDEVETQKHICHIRSPDSEKRAAHCKKALRECEKGLAEELYEDCLDLKKYRDVTCEKSYVHHQNMINVLLGYMENNTVHDDRSALIGVAHLLPARVKQKQDNQRKWNFEALSINLEQIDWCSVGKNYVCIKRDYDKSKNICDAKQLEELKKECKRNTKKSG